MPPLSRTSGITCVISVRWMPWLATNVVFYFICTPVKPFHLFAYTIVKQKGIYFDFPIPIFKNKVIKLICCFKVNAPCDKLLRISLTAIMRVFCGQYIITRLPLNNYREMDTTSRLIDLPHDGTSSRPLLRTCPVPLHKNTPALDPRRGAP